MRGQKLAKYFKLPQDGYPLQLPSTTPYTKIDFARTHDLLQFKEQIKEENDLRIKVQSGLQQYNEITYEN